MWQQDGAAPMDVGRIVGVEEEAALASVERTMEQQAWRTEKLHGQ